MPIPGRKPTRAAKARLWVWLVAALSLASFETPMMGQPYYYFTTIAGRAPVPGSVDGAALDARFYWPSGLALDRFGNIYVADNGNSTIRKIGTDGKVTTLAGAAGMSGLMDGTGPNARFSSPHRLAIDGEGNVLVADTWIRKVSPLGQVTTIWKTNSIDIALDSAGGIYSVGHDNATVVRITPTGTDTFAGQSGQVASVDGPLASALFKYPSGLAADGNSNIYVGQESGVIRKISAGNVSSLPIGGNGA